ncbi:MliC family protein [Hoeflea sp. G2-23]|uniref:MliC family protein n=1 Tax=Hoeflea algicola TaxID=2983763 RepID=A0ABT3Z727_9HYPH|nr:MliC family protein [Hoeflea algicola]MCY0147577.1 MliC family protein [Hoeflea algicola]
MSYNFRNVALTLLVPTTALFGVTVSVAMPAAPDSPRISQSIFVTQIAFNGVNGRNVIEISYPGGKISLNGKRWTERNANGSYKFEETHRDDWSVYLLDRSRNVRLQIDLHRKLVLYAAGNDQMQPLYQIVGATPRAGGQAGKQKNSDRTYRFTCTEGIPLVVRIRNRGGTSTAFVSLDGAAEMRLDQIISGSGTRYSDGNLTVSMKVRNAFVEWGSTQDSCRN